jgi:hypothetical protein
VGDAPIHERVQSLKAEIAQICTEEQRYRKTRRHFGLDIRTHEQRIVRLKEIMDELAELMNKPAAGA